MTMVFKVSSNVGDDTITVQFGSGVVPGNQPDELAQWLRNTLADYYDFEDLDVTVEVQQIITP